MHCIPSKPCCEQSIHRWGLIYRYLPIERFPLSRQNCSLCGWVDSGLLPRLCLVLMPVQNFVIIGMSFAVLLIGVAIFYLWNRQVSLDLLMVWSFVVSPLVHDYDLIQLIPVLEKRKLHMAAILSSIPGWLTILLAYQDDKAWITFTLIAPILLGKMIISKEY